jgi:hypothetical protein
VLVEGRTVTGRGPGRLAAGVLVALLAVALGVMGNAAAGQQYWPGVLDLARRHPWPGVGIVALVGVVVEVVLWRWPRNESEPIAASAADTRTAVWSVPPRTAVFTGRHELLAELHRRLRAGGPVVQTLHGWGGVGKTTLAIEYAHRFAKDYWLVWWVDAERAELIGEQLAALGVEAGWVAKNAPTPEAVAVVRRQLHGSDGWLVLFDNAAGPAEVREWLPQGPGHVIVTSRSPNWEQVSAALPVDLFTRTESLLLLQRLSPSLGPELADRISDLLGDLPLAITQAGGVLAETGIGGPAYMDELRQHAARVMAHGQAAGYSGSLAAAIQLAVDKVAAEDRAAVQLLQVCAMLAPEPVPLDLLLTRASVELVPEPLASVAASALAWGGCVARLGRYGLVKPSQDGPILHRLTQAIIADQLDPDTRTRTRTQAEYLLTAAKPANSNDPVWWAVWARLLPHLIALDPAATTNPQLRQMAREATWYLLARGDLTAGHALARQLHQTWQHCLGDDHPDTCTPPTTSPMPAGCVATTTGPTNLTRTR